MNSVRNKTYTLYNVITSIFHLNTAPLKYETDSVSAQCMGWIQVSFFFAQKNPEHKYMHSVGQRDKKFQLAFHAKTNRKLLQQKKNEAQCGRTSVKKLTVIYVLKSWCATTSDCGWVHYKFVCANEWKTEAATEWVMYCLNINWHLQKCMYECECSGCARECNNGFVVIFLRHLISVLPFLVLLRFLLHHRRRRCRVNSSFYLFPFSNCEFFGNNSWINWKSLLMHWMWCDVTMKYIEISLQFRFLTKNERGREKKIAKEL